MTGGLCLQVVLAGCLVLLTSCGPAPSEEVGTPPDEAGKQRIVTYDVAERLLGFPVPQPSHVPGGLEPSGYVYVDEKDRPFAAVTVPYFLSRGESSIGIDAMLLRVELRPRSVDLAVGDSVQIGTTEVSVSELGSNVHAEWYDGRLFVLDLVGGSRDREDVAIVRAEAMKVAESIIEP